MEKLSGSCLCGGVRYEAEGGRCGSPLFKRKGDPPESVRLRLGCVDGPIHQRPELHVFVAEKPEWSEISDALPQFAKLPG